MLMFFENNIEFRDKTAVIDEQLKTHTYEDLWSKIRDLNVSKKSGLVFNLCENHISSLAAYLAFLQNRNTKQLLLSPKINEDFLNNLVAAYKPNYICLPHSNSYAFDDFKIAQEDSDFKLLEAKSHFQNVFSEELAILLPTSGSTGSPKLVRLSYENLASNADAIATYLEIVDHDKPITTLPMNYALGLSVINSHLHKGAAIVLNSYAITEKNFWDLIHKSKATSLSGVPFTFEMLRKLKFDKMELPNLKYLAQAGGKLRSDIVKEFADHCNRKGLRFYVMYGQTEATARMSYLPWDKCALKPDSIGIPIPGGEFLLLSENGDLIKDDNTIGDLIYKGKNVSLGYALTPADLALGDTNKGTLSTGDLALRDKDGFYKIVGRKSRFIKICGTRFGLEEIENLLQQNGIAAACSGEDDKLIVFFTDSSKYEAAKELLSKTLAINPRYISFRTVVEIPRNEHGKIIYTKLAELDAKEIAR